MTDDIDVLNRQVGMLTAFQFLTLGCVGFLVLNELGEPGSGANVFLLSAGAAVVYYVLTIYHPVKRYVGRWRSDA